MTQTRPLRDHVFTIDIGVDRTRVWEEITKTGRIQRAMNNTVLEGRLVPGSKLRYYSPDHKRVFVVGEVLEVSPPQRFSHTFLFTMREEEPTVVTWDLEAIPGGCRVTLTHTKWTDQAKTHKGVAKGWRAILEVLKRDLETGDIPLRTKLIYRTMGALSFLLPSSTKPEEVTKAGW